MHVTLVLSMEPCSENYSVAVEQIHDSQHTEHIPPLIVSFLLLANKSEPC